MNSDREFEISGYRALSLIGPAGLSAGTEYISFTGDYGFFRRSPNRTAIEAHLQHERPLLANFCRRVINLEYMLNGSTGRKRLLKIDDVSLEILQRAGFDVISRANNHAMQFGLPGVEYNAHKLISAGFSLLGTRDFPVYALRAGGLNVAVYSMTDTTDRPDPDGVILKIDDRGIQAVRDATKGADYRIAFLHLGSMSFYPSPHERSQVNRVLDAGTDLVICTGNHYIKGFMYERGQPVAYGIGNHLFSWAEKDTEPIGMHMVVGFRDRRLSQVIAIPFHNEIMRGRTGALDDATFESFKETLADRSISDPSRYYSDPRTVAGVRSRLASLNRTKLKRLRIRHFVYAARILLCNFGIAGIAAGLYSRIAKSTARRTFPGTRLGS